MTVDQLYEHYKTWGEMSYQLRLSPYTYRYWIKKGYIPYSTQCMIEKKTNGMFKASFEDASKKEINDDDKR